MKLVPDAKHSWKWFSMQAMTLAGAIQGAWLFIPDDLKETVGTDTAAWITALLMVLGIIGRLKDQPE